MARDIHSDDIWPSQSMQITIFQTTARARYVFIAWEKSAISKFNISVFFHSQTDDKFSVDFGVRLIKCTNIFPTSIDSPGPYRITLLFVKVTMAIMPFSIVWVGLFLPLISLICNLTWHWAYIFARIFPNIVAHILSTCLHADNICRRISLLSMWHFFLWGMRNVLSWTISPETDNTRVTLQNMSRDQCFPRIFFPVL